MHFGDNFRHSNSISYCNKAFEVIWTIFDEFRNGSVEMC